MPLGTFGTYSATGSVRRSLPSWASSMISAAVIVLVLDAIRKWVPAVGYLGVQLGGADGRGDVPLGRAQDDHRTGHAHLLGQSCNDGLQAGRIDRPQRGTGGRGSPRNRQATAR